MKTEVIVRWTAILLSSIAILTVLKIADDIFAPLLMALVIGVVLSPVTDAMERSGLPKVVGALLALGIGLSLLSALVIALEPVAVNAMTKGPRIAAELRTLIEDAAWFLQGLDTMSSEVADAIGTKEQAPGPTEGGVGVEVPTLTDALVYAPALVAQVLIFIGSLFFFILSRNDIYKWIAHRAAPGRDRLEVALLLRRAERRVSKYFLTISVINAVFGAVVALALHAIGMPAPMVWGVVAFLMNFILYLGPAVVAVLLFLAGLLTFGGAAGLLPAAIFVGLNMIEGQFVTPALVGRHMRVNPLLVFLSLIFWLWLWGPIGGIIAIPLLIWGLAVSVGLPTLAPQTDQTISSGTPGNERPKSLAGRSV